jgi:hypothetical protein
MLVKFFDFLGLGGLGVVVVGGTFLGEFGFFLEPLLFLVDNR